MKINEKENNRMLSRIRTVLMSSSHPGNIGATARALKNMGLSKLVLVNPKNFPAKEAEAFASNAQDILANAKVFSSLVEALAGCSFVYGCSARQRKLTLPCYTAREAAAKIKDYFAAKAVEANTQKDTSEGEIDIAILFGNEQHGLSNAELDYCNAQIIIPTTENYASLNLAQAVQIVSYELFLAAMQGATMQSEIMQSVASSGNKKLSSNSSSNLLSNITLEEPANFEALAEFYTELEKTLIHIKYLDPKKPGQMLRHLKHLFARAEMNKTELTLLRGMLTAIQKSK